MIKNLLSRTFWFVLNIAVLVLTEGLERTKNSYSINPKEICTFDQQLASDECPSLGECECVEKRAFGIRSREFEGNIIKYKDLAAGSPCEHRIRKEIMTLSREERLRYIHAVKSVRTDPRTSKRFYDLGHIHVDYFCKVLHCTVFFLPWHRWFILQYENLLREIEPNVTLVYWDWSMVMVNPFDTNLWDDNEWSFGGSGYGVNNTVTTGAFKEPEFQMVPRYGPDAALQLRRKLSHTYPGPGIPSALHLALLMKLKPYEIKDWLIIFQSWHDNVHNKAFGWKATMTNTYSAWTPEFFLHHTFVDKYWSDWQAQGYKYKYIEYFMKQTRYMQGTHYLPRDFMDIKYQEGNVCVTYQKSSNDWIHKMLRSLSIDQLRNIRGLPIVPFVDRNVRKWNPKSSIFINTTNHWFMKNYELRNPITLEKLDGTDRQRGFRLHDLIEMSSKNSVN